ncbi:MAG: hypothetical protein GF344_04010, partial [Chitinivibrionales bacterium]|nr:hypothetical protein [Chitinivibrionales bacterium]MBD3356218.1 hypothetical protein [Chitinivibrionales bacterium]
MQTCFLLTHSHRDVSQGLVITLYGASGEGPPVRVLIDNFRPPFFVSRDTPESLTQEADERKPLAMHSMDGYDVDCLYFRTYTELQNCAKRLRRAGVRTYESDVHPVERFLMERRVAGGFRVEGEERIEKGVAVYRNPRIRGADVTTKFRVLSLDIETCVSTRRLYSIACAARRRTVLMIGDLDDTDEISYCRDEKELLVRFLTVMADEDPDVIIGWNIVDFDLSFLARRFEAHRIPFA